MKRYIILWIAVLFTLGRLGAQTSGSNWAKTRTAISETGTAVTDITYYNGLGLPSQTVSVAATVNGYDWVTPIEYDAMLRNDAKIHLPYEATNTDGCENDNALSDQQSFYEERYGVDYSRSFAENVYEASPLGRIRQQALPGYMNDDVRYSTIGYRANDGGEVRKLSVDGSGMLVSDGYYAAGTLSCTETTDADGHVVRVFTDGRGPALLKRSVNGSEPLDTYSVYDDYGRLRWVVSPEGSRQLGSDTYASTSVFAGQYCYVYLYDGRGRVVEKRLPGCGAEYLVYDRGDRVVMSQDGAQRVQQKWTTCRYDALGRLRMQGLVTDTASATRPELQSSFDNEQTPDLYDDNSARLIRQYVYDDYPSGMSASGLGFEQIEGLTGNNGQSQCFDGTQGYLTYEKLAVFAGGGITGYHERACYYDYKGRRIQTVGKGSGGGKLCTSTRYDFVGNVVAQREHYVLGTIDDRIDRTYVYDNRSRLLSETTTLNGHTQGAVVEYAYDDRGRICGKTYGSGAGAVHETMEYDIRGWLTNRSGELFAMSLRYYDRAGLHGPTVPSYTGNIAEWDWQHKGDAAGDNPQNCYAFSYDGVARLTGAKQYIDGTANDRFVEKGLAYDRNGNIRTLQRTADGTTTDNFSYTYAGNRLSALSGTTSGTYAYDANGNMVRDGVNGLDISYNKLNLIESVEQNGGIVAEYSYLSDGTKLSATDSAGNGLCYFGSLVYRKQGDVLTLESAGFSGGRFVVSETTSGTTCRPHYFITDHLGSVRVVVGADGEVVERNDYYPFGLRWEDTHSMASDNRYRYNGKEAQAFVGIPYSDYGARMYDPKYRLGWNGMDPLTVKYHQVSSYIYCLNNPVNAIDPDGNVVIFINGMHTGDGGGTAYWGGFDNAVMKHLNDFNSRYYDGSVGGSLALSFGPQGPATRNNMDPEFRYEAGYIAGKKDALLILNQLSEKETIKIITHSMGAAYAKGFVQALIDQGVDLSRFAFEADFAPFQPTKQKAVEGVNTFQFTNKGDNVANNKLLGSPYGKIQNVTVLISNDDKTKGHSIDDFWDQINNLPAGKYRVENGAIIKYE